ncbi:MAG: hypothetical protein ACJ71P_14260 [Nitrososphaeraceae archaeon]|jgi:hypothetical protein
MKSDEFEQFLKFAGDHSLYDKSDAEKIHTFISWCKRIGVEEVIMRLSSETKGGWGKNFLLDFTTHRIVISKKKFIRKFVDVGYIAGMAPFPYMLVSKQKLELSDLKKGSAIMINPEDSLEKDSSSNFFIPYSEIREVIIRKGVESVVTNMLGSMITANFLTIKTSRKTYDYRLPVSKNGTFEQIHYWLSVVVPAKVFAH